MAEGDPRPGCVGYHSKGIRLPPMCPPEAIDKAMNLDLQEGDIMVVNYPKTGTFWMEELIWLLHNPDNMAAVKTKPLMHRCPRIEKGNNGKFPADLTKSLPRPWIVGTHLTPAFLQKHIDNHVKIVVPIREPKDTLVSLYNFYKFVPVFKFDGSWDDFFQLFKEEQLIFGDFFKWYESWIPYIEKGIVKIVTYENMKKDLRAVICDVAAFLDVSPQEEDVEKMLPYLTFETMKANRQGEVDNMLQNFTKNPPPAERPGSYFRKGIIGDWRNYFNEEQRQYVDQRYETSLISNFVKF